jgi:hypothetical protein
MSSPTREATKGLVENVATVFGAAKMKLREYRLFAKEKTTAPKDKLVAQMTSVIEKANNMLGQALQDVAAETIASASG